MTFSVDWVGSAHTWGCVRSFGRTAEQKIEFELIDGYISMIARHTAALAPEQLPVLTKWACIPEMRSGKSHLKEVNLKSGAREQGRALAELEIRDRGRIAQIALSNKHVRCRSRMDPIWVVSLPRKCVRCIIDE